MMNKVTYLRLEVETNNHVENTEGPFLLIFLLGAMNYKVIYQLGIRRDTLFGRKSRKLSVLVSFLSARRIDK